MEERHSRSQRHPRTQQCRRPSKYSAISNGGTSALMPGQRGLDCAASIRRCGPRQQDLIVPFLRVPSSVAVHLVHVPAPFSWQMPQQPSPASTCTTPQPSPQWCFADVSTTSMNSPGAAPYASPLHSQYRSNELGAASTALVSAGPEHLD